MAGKRNEHFQNQTVNRIHKAKYFATLNLNLIIIFTTSLHDILYSLYSSSKIESIFFTTRNNSCNNSTTHWWMPREWMKQARNCMSGKLYVRYCWLQMSSSTYPKPLPSFFLSRHEYRFWPRNADYDVRPERSNACPHADSSEDAAAHSREEKTCHHQPLAQQQKTKRW